MYVENPAPEDYALHQNYPNPFNPATIITFGVPVKSQVSLRVFNSIGELVALLVNEEKPAGRYEVEFDGGSLSSGVYFYRLKAGEYTSVKKMILIR